MCGRCVWWGEQRRKGRNGPVTFWRPCVSWPTVSIRRILACCVSSTKNSTDVVTLVLQSLLKGMSGCSSRRTTLVFPEQVSPSMTTLKIGLPETGALSELRPRTDPPLVARRAAPGDAGPGKGGGGRSSGTEQRARSALVRGEAARPVSRAAPAGPRGGWADLAAAFPRRGNNNGKKRKETERNGRGDAKRELSGRELACGAGGAWCRGVARPAIRLPVRGHARCQGEKVVAVRDGVGVGLRGVPPRLGVGRPAVGEQRAEGLHLGPLAGQRRALAGLNRLMLTTAQ